MNEQSGCVLCVLSASLSCRLRAKRAGTSSCGRPPTRHRLLRRRGCRSRRQRLQHPLWRRTQPSIHLQQPPPQGCQQLPPRLVPSHSLPGFQLLRGRSLPTRPSRPCKSVVKCNGHALALREQRRRRRRQWRRRRHDPRAPHAPYVPPLPLPPPPSRADR